jgi:hypothetical protein
MAAGPGPLGFQWQRDGVALAGATYSWLVIDRLAPDAAGRYEVVVVNALGSALSRSVTLAAPPPELRFDTANGALRWEGTGLHLRLTGLSGTGQVVIYSSPNLVDWLPSIATNAPLSGASLELLIPAEFTSPAQYFRAVQTGRN